MATKPRVDAAAARTKCGYSSIIMRQAGLFFILWYTFDGFILVSSRDRKSLMF